MIMNKNLRNKHLKCTFLCFVVFCITFSLFSSAERAILPGEDVSEVIENSPLENVFLLQAELTKPTVFTTRKPILVDRDISIIGAPGTIVPVTFLPIDIILAGNTVWNDVVINGDFESPLGVVWKQDINPPDPIDPSYVSIIQENTYALSPSHLALFKGIAKDQPPYQISQNFVLPPSVDLDAHIWQEGIGLPQITYAIDEIQSVPIIFPYGKEFGVTNVGNTLPLSVGLPNPVDIISGYFSFDVMREMGNPTVNDRLDIWISSGDQRIFYTVILSSIPQPFVWFPQGFDVMPLIMDYGTGDIPNFSIMILKRGLVPIYIDNLRLTLQTNLGNLVLPLLCGDFEGPVCTPWIGEGEFGIVNDPTNGLNHCFRLGSPPILNREVWLEFFVKTDRFSGKLTDNLQVLFDEGFLPTAFYVENEVGEFIPMPHYLPTLVPNRNDYVRVIAQVPPFLTVEERPHTISFRSTVSPSAESPDSPEENTTIFSVDDVGFLVGTIDNLVRADSIYAIPNGNFEAGNDGSWRLSYVYPSVTGRDIEDLIVSEGGRDAPHCARLGGLPPAKISFYVYPNNVDTVRDYFKVWIGDNEFDNLKLVCDTRISGMPSQGNWNLVEKWLVPPLLEPSEFVFNLHIKGRVRTSGNNSFILFDDFCVSPYGGRGELWNVYDVCDNNAVRNPSFETFPDSEWSVNEIASKMGPIHCYDTAYPQDCFLPVPAHTGFRAIWLASVPEEIMFNFWLKILGGLLGSSARLEILIDDQVIRTIFSDEQQYWDVYNPVILSQEIVQFMDGNVHKLTLRVPSNDCSNSPVRFLIDDVCIGYQVLVPGRGEECLNPLVNDGGFELGVNTPWDALPSIGEVVRGGPDSHKGFWYVQLEQAKPDIRMLWQENINIPPAAELLSFYIKVQKGNSPEKAKLSVYWDSISGNAVWSKSGDELEEGDWIEQKVSLPQGLVGAHSLYFVYESCRDVVPTIFMVDNITLQRSNFPLIQVEQNGSLCLENLTLSRGTTGVLNMGGRAKLYRIFIHPSVDKGVETLEGSHTLISQSIIHGVKNQAVENRGDLVVFQSTIRDNGNGVENYGEGKAIVMTSIIWNNMGRALFSESEGGIVSGWNYIEPNLISGVTTVGEPITVRPSFIDDPWIGKLEYPVPARVALDNILNSYIPDSFKVELRTQPGCSEGSIGDFENDIRDVVNLQVGADEITIAGSELFWTYCRVSPVVPRVITGRSRDIGIGNSFEVDVGIRGPISLANAVLYLVPEEYITKVTASANPLNALEKLPSDFKQPVIMEGVDNQRGTSMFIIRDLFFVDDDGDKWTTNGRARLYLWVGPALIGIGLPEEYRMQFPLEDSEFVIDTVSPKLASDIYNSGIGSIVTQNNDIFPPSNGRFPSDWCPYSLSPSAYSGGLIGNQDNLYPHIFFNNPEGSLLDFNVNCAFYDPYPEDEGGVRVVEVSGFIVNQSIQPVVSPQTVFDLLMSGPVFPGFELNLFRTLGCARWVALNDLNRVLSYSPNAQVNYIAYPIGNEGFRSLGVTWELSNLNFGPDWHIKFRFDVKDLSGNPLVESDNVQDGINIWWMLNPVTVKTSVDKVGAWTGSPRLEWIFRRSVSEAPERADPCYPLFGVRVWSVLNPFDYLNSPWVPVGSFSGVGNWGWIKNQASLDKNTPIYLNDTVYITLNDIITAKETCGALLMATVVGADEAGNVQTGYVELSGAQLQNLAVVENLGVPYMIWRNPCELDIDTQLEVNTWWNRVTAPLEFLRFINLNLGERDFGSSGRVPLPPIEDSCDYRVEVKLTMTNVLPSDTFNVSNHGFDIQVFEDGKMVRAGTITMTGGGTSAEIFIPTDIFSPPDSSQVGFSINWYSGVDDFLNAPPKHCGGVRDRLGDEGSPEDGYRRREVKYDFVVRAFVQDASTGAIVTDQTPAKFTLIIYPPRGELEKGLRGPAFPKEEQKIKIYKREF